MPISPTFRTVLAANTSKSGVRISPPKRSVASSISRCAGSGYTRVPIYAGALLLPGSLAAELQPIATGTTAARVDASRPDAFHRAVE